MSEMTANSFAGGRVTGFPTYVLIGPDGTIINKYPGVFNADFRAEIEQAVRDAGRSVAAR